MPNLFLSHKRAKIAGCMPHPWRGAAVASPRIWADTPRSGPRTAGFSDEVAAGTKSENALGVGVLQERLGHEAVHRMGHVGRAGSHGCGGKCARLGAIRNREIAILGRVRHRQSL